MKVFIAIHNVVHATNLNLKFPPKYNVVILHVVSWIIMRLYSVNNMALSTCRDNVKQVTNDVLNVSNVHENITDLLFALHNNR